MSEGFSVVTYSAARRAPISVDVGTLDAAFRAACVAMGKVQTNGSLRIGDEVMIYQEPNHEQLFGATRIGETQWAPYQVNGR